jgi:hypothetical protein
MRWSSLNLRILGIALALFLVAASAFGQDNPPAPDKPPTSPSDAPKSNAPESTLDKIRNLPAERLIGPYIPIKGPLFPLTNQQRAEVYARQTFITAGPYIEKLFVAGIDQARGVPAQWGGGMAGYADRFGSRYGQFAISNTFHAIGNAALGYEPRYDLCRCTGFWPRTRHAVVMNFVNYNRTERELRPATPLYVGSFGAGMISSVWLPAHRNPWGQGGYAVLSQAAWGSAYNWVSEFSLDILRKISKNKYAK